MNERRETIDALLKSLEEEVALGERSSGYGKEKELSAEIGVEDTVRDYFDDEVSSIDGEASRVNEVWEELRVQKRKVKRLAADVLQIKGLYDRERVLRERAEERERLLEEERRRLAQNVDSLLELLRVAYGDLEERRRRLEEVEGGLSHVSLKEAVGLGSRSTLVEDPVAGQPEPIPDSGAPETLASVSEQLRAKVRELELSEARRRQVEMDLDATRTELAAERIAKPRKK